MDILVGSESGQLQSKFSIRLAIFSLFLLEVKFASFTLNAKSQEAPEVAFSILKKQETSAGTGYPPVQFLSCHELQPNQRQIWIARNVGAFESFDLEQEVLTDKVIFPFAEDCKVVGVFPNENGLVAVSNNGDLAFWNDESEEATLKSLKAVEPAVAVKRGNLIALGGKGIKNNLQLWDLNDLESGKAKVLAKQTQNVRLNMPYPVDVRGIAFTQRDNSDVMVTCNADGQLWLYDLKVKRVPVIERQVQPKKTSLTSVYATPKDDCVIYTTSDGVVEYYDMRAGRSFGRFGPHEGAITDLHITTGAENGQGRLLITTCKDRFLRIFDFETRALLSKVYLKHVPTAFLVTKQPWLDILAKDYEDTEDEEFWEEMNQVPDKRTKLE